MKEGDSVLVLKKGSGDGAYWDIPGGRIDDNETLEDTLKRELREELPSLGEYKIGDVVSAYRLSKNIDDDRALVLIFYRIDAEPFEVVLSDEHTAYRWVTKETLPELLTSGIAIEKGYHNAIPQRLRSGDCNSYSILLLLKFSKTIVVRGASEACD